MCSYHLYVGDGQFTDREISLQTTVDGIKSILSSDRTIYLHKGSHIVLTALLRSDSKYTVDLIDPTKDMKERFSRVIVDRVEDVVRMIEETVSA